MKLEIVGEDNGFEPLGPDEFDPFDITVSFKDDGTLSFGGRVVELDEQGKPIPEDGGTMHEFPRGYVLVKDTKEADKGAILVSMPAWQRFVTKCVSDEIQSPLGIVDLPEGTTSQSRAYQHLGITP